MKTGRQEFGWMYRNVPVAFKMMVILIEDQGVDSLIVFCLTNQKGESRRKKAKR